jgi:hypothetical protein
MKSSARELYLTAIGLEPGARKRLLDEHCLDGAIRVEVDRLLAEEPTETIDFAIALAPGANLGHYIIQKSLGAGGMGVVFEAMDQKLHRTVAIKVLPPGLIDEDTRIRFLREAQVASALNHPNIVTVYEVGRESGIDFIVMERIGGQTLRPRPDSLLSGARFSPDERWVAFHTVEGISKAARVWIAPVNLEHPAPHSDWIAVTAEAEFAQDPCWSANDNVLYFTSQRDGFRCFWAQPLDSRTLKPAGDPFALRHFHSARQSLRGLASEGYLVGLSSGANRLVSAFPELTGNIWLQETARAK